MKDNLRRKYVSILPSGLAMAFSLLFSSVNPVNSSSIPSGVANYQKKAAGQNLSYILGPGDRIQVDVFQLPQYGGQFDVSVNGSVNLPRVGTVYLQGATLEEASRIISAKYSSSRIIRQPLLTLTLIAPRPIRVGIAGEVIRSGSYTIPF